MKKRVQCDHTSVNGVQVRWQKNAREERVLSCRWRLPLLGKALGNLHFPLSVFFVLLRFYNDYVLDMLLGQNNEAGFGLKKRNTSLSVCPSTELLRMSEEPVGKRRILPQSSQNRKRLEGEDLRLLCSEALEIKSICRSRKAKCCVQCLEGTVEASPGIGSGFQEILEWRYVHHDD